MYKSLGRVSDLSQAKPLICNRIPGHVADQNYIAIIDSNMNMQIWGLVGQYYHFQIKVQ